MNQSETVNEGASMTPQQITSTVRHMMAQAAQDQKVAFYDHWLTRLGLDPVIKRMEVEHALKYV